jgi:hypothetical protein
MKIKYVDFGIANNYGDEIELNINLKKYPKLHNEILNHELKHSQKRPLTHIRADFLEKGVSNWKLFKFCLKHPKGFKQIVPLYYHKEREQFIYDKNYFIMWGFGLLILYLTIKVIGLLL